MTISNSEWKRMGNMIEDKVALGTLTAIKRHREECSSKNDKVFISRKECSSKRSECQSNLKSRIDAAHPIYEHAHNPHSGTVHDDSPTITVQFSDHFNKHGTKYGIGIIGLINVSIAIFVGLEKAGII